MRSPNRYTREYPEHIADSSWALTGYKFVHGVTLELNSCRYLKLHFESPGAPQSESLNHLADGMTAPKAARLFYQACGMEQF